MIAVLASGLLGAGNSWALGCCSTHSPTVSPLALSQSHAACCCISSSSAAESTKSSSCGNQGMADCHCLTCPSSMGCSQVLFFQAEYSFLRQPIDAASAFAWSQRARQLVYQPPVPPPRFVI